MISCYPYNIIRVYCIKVDNNWQKTISMFITAIESSINIDRHREYNIHKRGYARPREVIGVAQVGSGLRLVRLSKDKDNPGEGGGAENGEIKQRRGEERSKGEKREKERWVSSRNLPCERLFLDLVELLEGLFREKSLQSLGRGSEMPRDVGSLEQAVRGHGRCCQGSQNIEFRNWRKFQKTAQKPRCDVEIPESDAHTKSVSPLPSFSLTPILSFDRAIMINASARARVAHLFPSTPRSTKYYRVTIARESG